MCAMFTCIEDPYSCKTEWMILQYTCCQSQISLFYTEIRTFSFLTPILLNGHICHVCLDQEHLSNQAKSHHSGVSEAI